MKITLVLHNLRSVYNVGAILRTAEGLGVERVVYAGYTPRFADARLLPHLREKLNRQISKAALGAEQLVRQTAVEDLPAWLSKERARGVRVLGLENNLAPTEQARVRQLGSAELATGLRSAEQVILVLGEEVAGIPTEVRAECELFIEIPMQGRKESFNVSVATGIALWGLEQLATQR